MNRLVCARCRIFSGKDPMIYLFVVATLFFFCTSSNLYCQKVHIQSGKKLKKQFQDSGTSFFEIIPNENPNDESLHYRTIETQYSVDGFCLDSARGIESFIVKTTTTTENVGFEQPNQTIDIEFRKFKKPKKVAFEIHENVNSIDLDTYTYTTHKYDCNEVVCSELYSYQNGLVLTGSIILSASIPNSPVKFNVAYDQHNDDSLTIGQVILNYGVNNQYIIYIRLDTLLTDPCYDLSPNHFSISTSEKPVIIKVGNTYDIWSLNKIESIEEIKNVNIDISFDSCENKNSGSISLINGKPFGKNDRVQYITLKSK